jgi:iron complex transport system permease protein
MVTPTVTAPSPVPDTATADAPTRRVHHRWRRPGLVGLAVLVPVVAAASIAVGAKSLPLSAVWDALVSYDPTREADLIVRELRMPRTLLALVVGAALGMSGAVMQGVSRNPLADPGLLGINAGAATGVVGGIYLLGIASTSGTVWLALGGAAAASLLVYGLGSAGRGGPTPVKLTIAGAALSALFMSLTTAMLLLDRATLDQYRFWAVGSVSGRDLDVIVSLLPFFALGTVLALASCRALDSMALGDDVARSLGQRIGRARAVAAASIVLLCGAATAAAGPIWFVGLIVAHMARALTGNTHRWLLPYAALMGAVLLTTADVLGRVLARPGELEVGIVTAFLGGPVFIAFVRRKRIAEL